MGSSRGIRNDLASALDRVALVLIGIYIILFITSAIPLRFSDPRWATAILDSLRAIAFLPLIGGVLILLANQMDPQSKIITKHRKWVRKFAPLVALGFFLIIPLQGLASYNIIRAGNSQATQKIATITRGMAMIRDAQDETALRAGINAIGIQNLPQGKLIIPIATVKGQILPQLSTEILKLKNESEKQRQRALQGLIFQWLRDGAVALLYGFGFKGLTMRSESEVIANPPLGADLQIPDRRLKLDDKKPIQP
jgi:hypothetical protein